MGGTGIHDIFPGLCYFSVSLESLDKEVNLCIWKKLLIHSGLWAQAFYRNTNLCLSELEDDWKNLLQELVTENTVQYRPEESKLVVTHLGMSRQCALKSADKIEILELPPDKSL